MATREVAQKGPRAIEDLQNQIDDLTTLLAGVTRPADPVSGAGTLMFESMNLQGVNGTGGTEGATNATDNVIIGYNAGTNLDASDKAGSHNLVIGDNHTYTSYAGIISGLQHTVTEQRAAAVGGFGNTASAEDAAVVGGLANTASEPFSAVLGGNGNTAGGGAAVVAGGQSNTALETDSFIGGGFGGATP